MTAVVLEMKCGCGTEIRAECASHAVYTRVLSDWRAVHGEACAAMGIRDHTHDGFVQIDDSLDKLVVRVRHLENLMANIPVLLTQSNESFETKISGAFAGWGREARRANLIVYRDDSKKAVVFSRKDQQGQQVMVTDVQRNTGPLKDEDVMIDYVLALLYPAEVMAEVMNEPAETTPLERKAAAVKQKEEWLAKYQRPKKIKAKA